MPLIQTPVGDFALVIRGLRKSFLAGVQGCHARAIVLNGIDVDVRAGEIVGVCGAVGSGKTTLLLCMAGLLRPDAGTVQVHGVSPHRLVAYVDDASRSGSRLSPTQVLARALAAATPILLLDGVLGDLSTGSRTILGELASRGMTIVAADRDRSRLEPWVERVITIRDGTARSTLPPRKSPLRHTSPARVAEPNVGATPP
ncbi:MAG TPA: ATP-binding cassette domain-containing protein [Gemmatimonadaceae bacterium]